MAQHDYTIANQGFPAFRSDLNDALAAIVSNNSGATEPTTMFAHQMWVDTAANPSVLKIRNADNDAWITIGALDQTGDTFILRPAAGSATVPSYSTTSDTNTGVYFPGADRVGIATGGTPRVEVDASGNLLVGTTSVVNVTTGTEDGATFYSSGRNDLSRSGGSCLNLRRRTSDGSILLFYKDTTNVGSIGTTGGELYIDFGGSTGGAVSSRTLDDYEEGTWTPAYAFSTSGSVTQSLTLGAYTKIGNFVLVTFRIATSALSSPSGAVTINGLPFTSAGTNSGVTPGQVSGFGIDAPIRCQIGSSSSSISLLKNASNGTAVELQGADFASGSAKNLIDCSFSYRV